jgi:acyl-CoA synthetase (NDP forming)
VRRGDRLVVGVWQETGAAGRVVQDRLVTIARSAGMRLVGPNRMGVVSHLGGDRWLNGSYFWRIEHGGRFVVRQSVRCLRRHSSRT